MGDALAAEFYAVIGEVPSVSFGYENLELGLWEFLPKGGREV